MNEQSSLNPVAIIGAGTMGRGIAQIAATSGHAVQVVELNPTVRDEARAFLDRILRRQAEKGRMTSDEADAILARIQFTQELESVDSKSGLVVEAIVEDLSVKQNVFARLEQQVRSDAILATNTSSLPVTAIAASCVHPERVVGMHFFNPAPLLPLVEVVPGVQTAQRVADATFALARAWGKTPVRAKDTPGFIVNRVARPFYGEALRVFDEGIADAATIDWAMRSIGGFRMGPFELMDLIGNDINYTVTETVWTAFFYEPRYKPSFTQKRMVEAGRLGRKSGQGYFAYGDDADKPAPNEDEELGQQIVDRILAMLINEAADAVFWNVADVAAVDLAMTNGVNYPKGLLAWADELGPTTVLNRLDALYDDYREDRYRASPLLRRVARAGGTFHG